MTVKSKTRAQLVDIDKLNTPLGSAAMAYAARLDDPETPASAVAAIGKELRATLEELGRGSKTKADPVDELKAAREKRRGRRGA